MFYAISKRRRDINAAKARGFEIGWKEGFKIGLREGFKEGYEIGRREVLTAMATRLQAEPNANPTAILAELRAQFTPSSRPRQ